jgi:hypothetical protein
MKITGHARQRIREMDLSLDHVMSVVREPALRYRDFEHGDREHLCGDGIIAVVKNTPPPQSDKLITVLWWAPDKPFVRQENQ